LRKNWLLALPLAVLLVGVSACGGSEADGEASAPESSPGQEQKADPAAPEADLEGVPDVVAEVNGQEIPKDEFAETYEVQFQQSVAQTRTTGQEVDQEQLKKQVVESMISTKLLVQEAEDRDLSASDREVDRTLQQLAQQNGLESADGFLAALEDQGMGPDLVRSQVRTQLKVDQLLAAEAGDLQPTDDEIRTLYDQMVAQQEQAGGNGGGGSQVPPLRQVRPQLAEQVRSQKEAEVAQKLVTDLREDAEVVVHL
jgi:hypothetical protein